MPQLRQYQNRYMPFKMQSLFIFLTGLFFSYSAFSQVDTVRSLYSSLDTIETYNVGLRAETGPGYERYFVNDRPVDKLTYKKYKTKWDNIGICKPCFLKTYDVNDILVITSIQYTDCAVGLWTEYYPNGKIKLVGHFKENDSNNWTGLYKRGFCSVKNGEWIFYQTNGMRERTDIYKDGKLIVTK
jgi:antitoxin component YwqK of YwqJK toxin-antitoxin module